MKFSMARVAARGGFAVALLMFVGGCARPFGVASAPSSAGASGAVAASARPSVVATTTQIEDVARTIGGNEIDVIGLMPRDADPHSFEPTPQDVGKVSKASLILENGIGLEGWIGELIRNAGGNQPTVVVSKGLKIAKISSQFGAGATPDPHIWMDPINMVTVTDNVVENMMKIDPADAAKFRARGEKYKAELRALDKWAAARLAKVPPAHRKLVTTHDAMGYFAKRYGFTILGTVIPGPDADAETSAQQLAQLIQKIRVAKVPAIFAEASLNPKWVEQVASETGVKVVHDLQIGALGPVGQPNGTYLGFFRSDVEKIAEALQ